MTGYQLSITNHEVDGFSNSFQHVKNSKNLENWLASLKCIFTCNLKTRFWRHKDFGRITKATMMHHSRSKKYTLMEQFFFKIYIAHLFLSIVQQVWVNPAALSRDIGNSSSQSTIDIRNHTQAKLHDQTRASMNILLDAKSKLSTSYSFWVIKI